MGQETSSQVCLFRQIKEKIPSNLSFVHEVSELLGISYDSAYRRIRGEKELAMEELEKLCQHYSISVDAFFNLSRDCIMFNSLPIGDNGKTFGEWLQSIVADMRGIHDAHDREIYYFAKDIPLFHYLEFPRIFAFKKFFWHKALLPGTIPDKTFNPGSAPDDLVEMGRHLLASYNKISVTEIWNMESFDSILRQIEFCYVSGYFGTKEDALELLAEVEVMIRHLQQQAEHGFRFFKGEEPVGVEGMYKLYLNEVLLGDNTILVNTNGHKKVYLTYNVINLLKTTDEVFCKQIEDSLRNLMQQSVLISSTAAKERNRFFNHLAAEIWNLMESISK
jgi:hypothetical protein